MGVCHFGSQGHSSNSAFCMLSIICCQLLEKQAAGPTSQYASAGPFRRHISHLEDAQQWIVKGTHNLIHNHLPIAIFFSLLKSESMPSLQMLSLLVRYGTSAKQASNDTNVRSPIAWSPTTISPKQLTNEVLQKRPTKCFRRDHAPIASEHL